MADPTPPSDRSQDPDWVQGLVTEALLRASEAEASPGPATETPGTDGAQLSIGRQGSDAPDPRSLEPIELPDNPFLHEPPPRAVAERAAARAAVAVSERPEVQGEEAFEVAEPGGELEEEEVSTEGFRSSDIRTVLEWLAVIVSALVVALIIKAFVLQAFSIPSASMETTVNIGDRILVNKVSYRLHDVRRGDLVVFKKVPGSTSSTDDLIKRAIALPGETIELRSDGRIWIWGPGETADDAKLLDEPYLSASNATLSPPRATDSISGDIWDENCVNAPRTPGRCTLAADQYFMMGDNRNASLDSRSFGPVTEDLIVGRAFLRIWPLGEFSSL